jgi:hypothetical protein
MENASQEESMEIEVQGLRGECVNLSYQMGLIMLHSSYISAQWHPKHVGVEVSSGFGMEKTFKVAFWPTNGLHVDNYQSFFFMIDDMAKTLLFFKKLGFPCPQPGE